MNNSSKMFLQPMPSSQEMLYPPTFGATHPNHPNRKRGSGAQRRKLKRARDADIKASKTNEETSIIPLQSFSDRVLRDPVVLNRQPPQQQRGTFPSPASSFPHTSLQAYQPPKPNQLFVHVRYHDVTKGDISPGDFSMALSHFRTAIAAVKGILAVKIAGIRMIRGLMEIECHSELTRRWVQDLIPSVMDGHFRLAMLDDVQVQVPTRIVQVWVRERSTPNPERLFSLMKTQNPEHELDTESWQLIRATPVKGGQFLLIRMDQESLNQVLPPAKLYYCYDLLEFQQMPMQFSPGCSY